jgi:hypothetical protein
MMFEALKRYQADRTFCLCSATRSSMVWNNARHFRIDDTRRQAAGIVYMPSGTLRMLLPMHTTAPTF